MKQHLLSGIAMLLFICLIGDANAAKHVIDVGNYYFNPVSITNVMVGDTIRWEWIEGTHTTTSTTIPVGALTWNSPIKISVPSFEYKVTVVGTYNYKCTPHASMGMVASFIAIAPAPTLSVLPANQNASSSGGSTTFTVASNSNWTTVSNASWCTSTSSGSGNGSIQAVYSANPSVNQRVATITITVSGLPQQNVTVTQAGAAPTLIVGPDDQNVGYLAGTSSFTVTSNSTWTAISEKDWCTVTPSGSGSGSITAIYAENPTSEIRIASITINVPGLLPQTVTLTQNGSTVSVNENLSSSVNIFPNPGRGVFSISLPNRNVTPIEISVVDAMGKTLLALRPSGSATTSFDLSSFVAGSYFIRVVSQDGVMTERLQLVK